MRQTVVYMPCFTGIWHFLFINDYSRWIAISLERVMEDRNPIGESPILCVRVLFEKPKRAYCWKVMCEGHAVTERIAGEISSRNRRKNQRKFILRKVTLTF